MITRMLHTLQDDPPLPPSLTALRLVHGHLIDLGDLAQGKEMRLSMAAEPTLAVRADVISCRLEWMVGGAEPHANHDAAMALHAGQFVSKLPAGFAALEMQAQRIAMGCGAAAREPMPEAAATVLCLFCAHAPASYRRLSLRWPDDLPLHVPLYIDMSWPVVGSTTLIGSGRVAFGRMDILAQCMQHCAATLNMSIAIHAVSPEYVGFTRL